MLYYGWTKKKKMLVAFRREFIIKWSFLQEEEEFEVDKLLCARLNVSMGAQTDRQIGVYSSFACIESHRYCIENFFLLLLFASISVDLVFMFCIQCCLLKNIHYFIIR